MANKEKLEKMVDLLSEQMTVLSNNLDYVRNELKNLDNEQPKENKETNDEAVLCTAYSFCEEEKIMSDAELLYNKQQYIGQHPKNDEKAYKEQRKVNSQKINNKIPLLKEINIEKFIGKNMMSIIASILIFIGLVMFGVVAFPYLGDVIRFALMILFSALFIIFSIVKLNRKESLFFTSTLACGVGALYITVIVGNVIYDLYGLIVTAILIVLWTIGITYCSRYKSVLFNIIGQIGIIASVMLVIIKVSEISTEETKIYYLMAMVVIITLEEIVYYTIYKNNREISEVMYSIGLAMILTSTVLLGSDLISIVIMILITAVILIGSNSIGKLISIVVAGSTFIQCNECSNMLGIVTLVSMVIIVVHFIFKNQQEKINAQNN